jgi:Kdo2-lipid IVA lauroyltransferase/acyltransferase
MKKIQHIIEYLSVVSALPFLLIIPYRIRCKIGEYIGLAIYYILKSRRTIAFNNVSGSFPDKNYLWYKKICRDSFRHLGISAMEFVQLKKFNIKFINKFITIEGEEYINEAFAHGKGIIGICPHLGNWEYVAAYIALKGYPVSAIMKRQSNRYINNLIERLRTSFGIELIYKSRAGFPVIRALKKNRIVAFVADQDAGKNGIFVDFLSRPASTAQGPARFALSYNSPAMIFAGVREKNGKIKIIISPILKFDYNKNNKTVIFKNTTQWTQAIEEYIKKYPEQYFWMHQRWKTKER